MFYQSTVEPHIELICDILATLLFSCTMKCLYKDITYQNTFKFGVDIVKHSQASIPVLVPIHGINLY